MPTNDELAALWREIVFQPEEWVVGGGHARRGHGGGVIALAPSIGRRAYIKPKKPLTSRAAANEKLAADLAHDLGVSVPPAVLTVPPKSGWEAQPIVVASLVMYDFQLHWGMAKHGTRNPAVNRDGATDSMRGAILSDSEWGAALRGMVPRPAARGLVFDCWVGQVDHDHPSNIAWGINPANEADNRLLFFDYEMAFGVGGWMAPKEPPFPAELLDLLDRHEVTRQVELLEKLDVNRLTETIDRIPESYLTEGDRTDMKEQLVKRRTLVRGALGDYMEEA